MADVTDEPARRPVQLSVRVEDALHQAIERRAREQRRSVSNFIAALLAEHVGHDAGGGAA